MLVLNDIKNGLPLPDNSVDMIYTDPPYLKKYLYCYEILANETMRVLRPGGFVMAMAGGYWLNKIFAFFESSGLDYFWNLQSVNLGNNTPYIYQRGVLSCSKTILCYSKNGGKLHVKSMRTVFAPKGKMKAYHHWGQDVGEARYFIEHCTRPNDTVLDPFIGGGTTAVACDLIGRKWIGMDNDPDALTTTENRLNETEIPTQAGLPIFAGL